MERELRRQENTRKGKQQKRRYRNKFGDMNLMNDWLERRESYAEMTVPRTTSEQLITQ